MLINYSNDDNFIAAFEDIYDNVIADYSGDLIAANESILSSVSNGIKWVIEKIMNLFRKILSLFGFGGSREAAGLANTIKETVKHARYPLEDFLVAAKNCSTLGLDTRVKHTEVLDAIIDTLSKTPDKVYSSSTRPLNEYPKELRDTVDRVWAVSRDTFAGVKLDALAAEIRTLHKDILRPYLKYTANAMLYTKDILDAVISGNYDKAADLFKEAASTIKAPINNVNVGGLTYSSLRKASNQLKRDGITITVPGGYAIETKPLQHGKSTAGNLKDLLIKSVDLARAMHEVIGDAEKASAWVKAGYEENAEKLNKVNLLLKGKSSPITGPIRQHLLTFVHTPQYTLDKYVISSIEKMDTLTKKVLKLLYMVIDVEVMLINSENVNGKSQ